MTEYRPPTNLSPIIGFGNPSYTRPSKVFVNSPRESKNWIRHQVLWTHDGNPAFGPGVHVDDDMSAYDRKAKEIYDKIRRGEMQDISGGLIIARSDLEY